MQQLFPHHELDVDPRALYARDPRPAPAHRPWVMVNMIASIDGGIAVDGVSGGLGRPADKVVFTAIRGVSDVILVGAGTVAAENYRRPQTPDSVQADRLARGQTALPRIAIVSNRLSLDAGHRVFDADAVPLVITSASAPAEQRRAIGDVAEVLECGDERVDLGLALATLRDRADVILAEGGPSLNGAIAAIDAVDELCLSLSPVLVGGDGPRIIAGAPPLAPPTTLELSRVLEGDGLTFHRFARTG